jgi:hypothetical protein
MSLPNRRSIRGSIPLHLEDEISSKRSGSAAARAAKSIAKLNANLGLILKRHDAPDNVTRKVLPRHVLQRPRRAAAYGELRRLPIASQRHELAAAEEGKASSGTATPLCTRGGQHLEQVNEHGQGLLVTDAGDAAAVARHVVHNLRVR